MTDEKSLHDEKAQHHEKAQPSPDRWNDLISQRIEEAMREGKFDNLRGKGKPLNPAPEPHVPPDMQMANSLLTNNDLTPAWISDRGQVLAAIERFRRQLHLALVDHHAARAAAQNPTERASEERRWQAQIAAWQEEVRTLNRRIELQNFKQPVTFLEIFKVRLDDEVRRTEREIEREIESKRLRE
jgi:hypothetical protein